MKPADFHLLAYLAEKGALDSECFCTTSEIAHALRTSQQTASRRLRELESAGLLERNATTSGIEVKLTRSGKKELQSQYSLLKRVFGRPSGKKILSGVVERGVGEGGYYVSLKGYLSQFREKLGIDPYAGTLNLRVSETELGKFLAGPEKVNIAGFKTRERSFGEIEAYPVAINTSPKGLSKGALIIPKRTTHPSNVVELISKDYLRGKLKLKDGDRVRVSSA